MTNEADPAVGPAGTGIGPGWVQPGASSDEIEAVERIRALPKEVGALLVVAGVGGILLPGPVGAPFLVLGGVILWPKAFDRVETWMSKRFPRLYSKSLRHIDRFLTDLDRRYPLSK